MSRNQSHENYDRVEKIKPGSEKSFGLTFAAVFLLLAILPLFSGRPLRIWALSISLLFAGVALLKPSLFRLPNLYWLKFGLILNRIVSPLILGLLFFAAFLPTGLLLRLSGKDILNLKIDKSKKSYWIRSPAEAGSMADQF